MIEYFARLHDNVFFIKLLFESVDKRSKMSVGKENKVNLFIFYIIDTTKKDKSWNLLIADW